MDTGLEGLTFIDLGATGFVAIIVWMVLTGKLKSSKDYDNLKEDYDKLLESVEKLSVSNEKLLSHAETTNQILQALPHPLDPRGRET